MNMRAYMSVRAPWLHRFRIEESNDSALLSAQMVRPRMYRLFALFHSHAYCSAYIGTSTTAKQHLESKVGMGRRFSGVVECKRVSGEQNR